METNAYCIILQGPPCSGKSTFAAMIPEFEVISRDKIRKELFGDNYKQNWKQEELVTEYEDYLYAEVKQKNLDVIIDNTNLKQKYIDRIEKLLPDHYHLIVRFKQPLWRLVYRNFKRYFQTKKWIPLRVLYRFYVQSKTI